MKARLTAVTLTLSLLLSLALAAPAAAASEEARIRAFIKHYLGLVSKGDFAAAAKLRAGRVRLPPKGHYVYWIMTKQAGALTKIEDVKIKGNQATAILHYDPAVARDIAKKVYELSYARLKKSIRDPQKRATVLGRMAKNKKNIIAGYAENWSRSQMELKKVGGKWLVVANAQID